MGKSLIQSGLKMGAPKLHTINVASTPKATQKVKLKSQTVEDELAEFNYFTVKDTTSKEENDYIKIVNSEEETTATGSNSKDFD